MHLAKDLQSFISHPLQHLLIALLLFDLLNTVLERLLTFLVLNLFLMLFNRRGNLVKRLQHFVDVDGDLS